MLKNFNNFNMKNYIFIMIFIMFFSALNITIIANGEDLPDLSIKSINSLDTANEGEKVTVIAEIENIGNKNIDIGTTVEIALYIDSIIVSTNSTSNGLPAGSSFSFNLMWIATLGDQTLRTLRVIVDYNDRIPEIREDNNVNDKIPGIYIYEKDTELEIIDVLTPKTFCINETVNIYTNITNNGKDTDNAVYVKLVTSGEGLIQIISKEDGLKRDETYSFSFEWTPQYFGSQTIKLEVYLTENNIEHIYEKIVFVEVGKLDWWDCNWHYRYFLVVEGNGNISLPFNFTQNLSDLNVVSNKFENNTIRLIEYNTNGNIVGDGEVKLYRFNESKGFNNETNATGILTWNVKGSSYEKYYCIYFDVESNPGNRTSYNETTNISQSGDVSIKNKGFVDGWWTEFIQPINGSFCLVNESVDITVFTKSKAKEVTAKIIWNADESHNYTLDLVDISDNLSWNYENFIFDKQGNWKITIFSIDNAGYEPVIVEHDFYVGIPDLELINISFETDWSPTSPDIYKNDKFKSKRIFELDFFNNREKALDAKTNFGMMLPDATYNYNANIGLDELILYQED